MVGDGCAGPPKPSICSDHSRHSAASASRTASLARSRACWALIFAPLTRSPKMRRLDGPPIALLQRPLRARAIPLGFEAGTVGDPTGTVNVQSLQNNQKYEA
jgi:hypothetical protein